MVDGDSDDGDFLLRFCSDLQQLNLGKEESEDDVSNERSAPPKKEEGEAAAGEEHNTTSSHHLQSINAAIYTHEVRPLGLSFQLWPAASTLLSLLDRSPSSLRLHPAPSPLRLLELGSGTGLPAIAAAALLPARATLTDLPRVLPNLHRNALLNTPLVASRGGHLAVRPLAWGCQEHLDAILDEMGGFDVVLATDVVYYEELIEPLLWTAERVVRGNVVWVMAHLRRWKRRDALFFRKARKVFDVDVVHTDPPFERYRTGVVVYRLVAKKPKGLHL